MVGQIRSADLLVKMIVSDEAEIDKVKASPKEALENIAQKAVQALPRVSNPSLKVGNAIWLIVVLSFAFVMLGSAYFLWVGVTNVQVKDATYFVKSETLYTVFSSVIAFLAGLLSPSPVGKG
jgi:hypothetical protein